MGLRISADWQRIYGHPIYFLETFVDPERFRGTCYRAANWVVLGKTTGRGKQCNSYVPNRSIKDVLGVSQSCLEASTLSSTFNGTKVQILSNDAGFRWRKRVGVEPTGDRIACRPPVLKTGTITGPHALPQGIK
jgi:hypothetical protein